MPDNRPLVFTFRDVVYDLGSRTHIMGVLNVTPDSFSDGGKFLSPLKAVEHGLRMVNEGADIVDVGGESTRPGSDMISAGEEIDRAVPVIQELARNSRVPISIDTYKSEVADPALRAGAAIVNDISGLRFDPRMAATVANHNASVVLMHMKGSPRTMQDDPQYADVVGEILAALKEGIRIAESAAIGQIMVDPGLGFGKNLSHNLELLRRLKSFAALGRPILVGASRKSFIGRLLDLPVHDRLEGTAAAVAVSVMNGANVVRVHDVREMKRVVTVVDAILRNGAIPGS